MLSTLETMTQVREKLRRLGFESNGRLLQGITLKLRHMYYRPKTLCEFQREEMQMQYLEMSVSL